MIKAAFTLHLIAFRRDAKTISDGLYVYTRNAIFGAIFGTERLCSSVPVKVVRSISDGFLGRFESSIVLGMESRERLCVLLLDYCKQCWSIKYNHSNRLYF